nr:HD-GYP domain-containing protein [Actinomycetota bacterium]
VIKEAEDRMYKHKLIENKSVRSSIITSLEKALAERDYETEEHTRRMKKYAILFGKALKLPDSKLDELSLLSTLHDIGKIAIPDNIILKPAELTEKERELIKKHSEIGYRIAMSTAELAPIADAILHHHERWDGNGYPYGLKGEKIPLTSRIIFIVDAYDAITNDRPYRKASSKEFALSEINRCSGLQFDPNITGIFINQVIHEGSNIKYYMKVEKQKANSVSKSF